MSFIPEEELRSRSGISLAPMIDFLFLMLLFFATLAITRVTTKDTDIDLVAIKPESVTSPSQSDQELNVIHVNIHADGTYKWVTQMRDHPMQNAEEIAKELENQYQKGLLPEEKAKTQVLLQIDKEATWEPILKAIFAIRDKGFDVRPVYQPEDPM